VLRHENKLAELRDARTWLVHITWNLALDRRRRTKTHHHSDDYEEVARSLTTGALSAETTLIAAQRHARILRLIDNLPAREREVLLLSVVKELSTVEIARVLQTTDSTIRSGCTVHVRHFRSTSEPDGSLIQRNGFRQPEEYPCTPGRSQAGSINGNPFSGSNSIRSCSR
jgi:RNA polymerase sigma factor (sigma-70 family)